MLNSWHRFTSSWKLNWITRIITVVILIFLLAILAYIFQELDTFKDSIWNNVASEIYEFLDEWAIIISAGVTLLLAITVGWVIMDNHHDKKVDRILRLQNDIISWATAVMKVLLVPSFNVQTIIQKNMREKLIGLTAVKIIAEIKAAEIMPDGELARKISNASTNLEQFTNNLEHIAETDFISLENPWKNLKQEFLDIMISASSVVTT